MPPDMLDGGVATVRVEVTDGVLDQVNTVVVQDQAAGRTIDADSVTTPQRMISR